MPLPLNQFTPDKQYDDGFTLIEIVMVLVLLGILSAVAVPKYFDLQEEAIAKKCQHNRGVVQSSVITQYAAAQLDGTADTLNKTTNGWADTINNVLTELNGSDCKNGDACHNLCEAGGHYTVNFTQTGGNLVVTVDCDWPGHGTTSSDSTNTSNIFFGKSEANFEDWLIQHYDELIDSTFTESSGGDRNAYIDGLSEKIKAALIKDGFDLSKSVLLIQRKDYGLFNDAGDCISETGSVPAGTNISNLHWRAKLFITVASSEGLTDGGTVSGTTYRMTLDYNKKSTGSEGEKIVEKFGKLTRDDAIGSTECSVKAAGKDDDGNNLFTIEPLPKS